MPRASLPMNTCNDDFYIRRRENSDREHCRSVLFNSFFKIYQRTLNIVLHELHLMRACRPHACLGWRFAESLGPFHLTNPPTACT